MGAPLYRLNAVTHAYNHRPVLQIDDLVIASQSIFGLIGPNGSGKSTLLKLLACIERPRSGQILFDGQVADPFAEGIRRQVTLLTQEPYLMRRSVYENVIYGLKIRADRSDRASRAEAALKMVGLRPMDFLNRPWNELSGGEAQRVALAARLILKPRALLLDEPNAKVDAESAQRIKDAVWMAREKWGTTLIIASHDWSWLNEICDTLLHLYNGRVIGRGMQNILTGNWVPAPENGWQQTLSDGQQVTVSAPGGKANRAVIIAPKDITVSVDRPETGNHWNRLSGTATRLVYEYASGEIVLTVRVAATSFIARISTGHLERHPIQPGQRIWLSFDPGCARWL